MTKTFTNTPWLDCEGKAWGIGRQFKVGSKFYHCHCRNRGWQTYRANTVRWRYNAVNFHKTRSIARPLMRDMGCNLQFDILIYILLHSTQCCRKYRVILDRVLTALDCILGPRDNTISIVQGHHNGYPIASLYRWLFGGYMYTRICLDSLEPEVGVTKPISSVPLFSELFSTVKLTIEYHVYICQVPPQLSCGDTCQIWMWSE